MGGVSLRRAAMALLAVLATASCTSSSGSTGSAENSTQSSDSTAEPTASPVGGSYLALGDSVPFGFAAGLTDEYQDPTNFIGYPELVGEDLGLDVINASCPGETTASFLDVTAQSNGCQNTATSTTGYRTNFPLHVAYDSADQSQLDFAVQTLQRTGDVQLVTVQIGANDAFVCQSRTAQRCQSPAEYQALAETIQTNLAEILTTLRGAGAYDGQIVVVGYYAFDYNSAAAAASMLLNGALASVASANGASVADAYVAFETASAGAGGDATAAGLLLPNDIHPSAAGQRVLADTVEAVVRP